MPTQIETASGPSSSSLPISSERARGGAAACAAPLALPLRVFISYKQKDVGAAERIGQLLAKIGNDNIDVFVAGDERSINPAMDWRATILKKLREAQVLIFLYTDPSLHWDWCLYETGYFDGRQDPGDLDRRLYVLHRAEDQPVGPFLGLKSVPIGAPDDPGETALKSMLKVLFEESTERSVNRNWALGGCEDLVRAFKEPFVGINRPPREYIRRLTFRLAKGAPTEETLMGGRIPAEAVISGTHHSFKLFGLGSDEPRPWHALEARWRAKARMPADGGAGVDPVTLWIENAASKMLAAIREEDFGDGLPLFYCHFANTQAQALFRPSLARKVERADVYEFDIVFVDVPAEMASVSAGPLTTVGSLLRLAHMFRFGWIEPMASDLASRPPGEVQEIAREMGRRLNSITAESFNQGICTGTAVLRAFQDGSDLQSQVREAMTAWNDSVAPALAKALENTNADGMHAAMARASEINWRFHRACALRYAELVEQYARDNAGPLVTV